MHKFLESIQLKGPIFDYGNSFSESEKADKQKVKDDISVVVSIANDLEVRVTIKWRKLQFRDMINFKATFTHYLVPIRLTQSLTSNLQLANFATSLLTQLFPSYTCIKSLN